MRVHARLCSPFEYHTYEKLKEIESLGHEMALHYEPGFALAVDEDDEQMVSSPTPGPLQPARRLLRLAGRVHSRRAVPTRRSTRHPDTGRWVETMRELASRTGMRELAVRSLLHGAALGNESDAAAAVLLAADIESPPLEVLLRRSTAG